MTEIVTGKVDVVARIEQVDRGRVPQDMNVTSIGWERGLGA
jgi:hypothetical protein